MKRFIIFTALCLIGTNTANANFDEYMYYAQLEARQNNGVHVEEIDGNYSILKEKTSFGYTERKFNRKNYNLSAVTDYDMQKQVLRELNFFETAYVDISNDENITIKLYYDKDNKDKYKYVAFDENDNFIEYVKNNKDNTFVDLSSNKNLQATSNIIYKNNKPLKMYLQLKNQNNQTINIYLDYITGKLLTRQQYTDLH